MHEKTLGYDFNAIEKKWQRFWEKNKTFKAVDCDTDRPKYYVLVEFPYPSSEGLHVGHPRSYTAMDVIARKRRQEGYNVLFPIGWDSFGLPAENFAIKTGVHPDESTQKNIANFKRQLKMIGLSFDWSREISTSDPAYYRWTQWMFLRLFEKGLAYKAEIPINWCTSCKVGLSNEEVVGGACERCGAPVIRKMRKQWMLRITRYAERLIDDLEPMDYLERIKTQQVNWIGKSIGADVDFKVDGSDKTIRVFTTRPDTLFGATYMVMAPEHPLVDKITSDERKKAVRKYREEAARKSDLDRTDLAKEKTGVFTGAYAINPVNDKKIPIWISDYVLISYGTGAIMSVPAHDERDFEFALKFGLSILPVIDNPNRMTKSFVLAETMKDGFAEALRSNGIAFKKDNGSLYVAIPEEKVEHYIELAKQFLLPGSWNEVLGTVWAFIFDDGLWKWNSLESEKRILDRCKTIEPNVRDKHTLMEMLWGCEFYRDVLYHDQYGTMIHSEEFTGTQGDVASQKVTEWLAEKGLGQKAINYKLRDWLFSRQRYWGEPIPLVECEKCGWVPIPEKELPLLLPKVEEFRSSKTGDSLLAGLTKWVNTTCPRCGGPGKRETDTMPQWAGSCWYFLRYVNPMNSTVFASKEALNYWMPVDWYNGGMEHTTLHLLYSRFWHKFLYDEGLVPCSEPYKRRTSHGMILGADNEKMSKSRANVVNPDDVVKEYGADTFRVYEMFIGAFDQAAPWSTQGMIGVFRFLNKVWNLLEKVSDKASSISSDNIRLMHKTIMRVGARIESMKFNTAISEIMYYTNELFSMNSVPKQMFEILCRLLYPFAPHIAEELWQRLGHKNSLAYESWPQYDSRLIKEKEIELAVQVNGKIKDRIIVAAEADEDQIKQKALSCEKVIAAMAGKKPKKIIVIKSRLVNIVV